MSSRYREHRYWSIAHDCEVARLMMADAMGREYFAVVERGRGYYQRRDDALLALEAAIEQGAEPGEVDTGQWPVYRPVAPPKHGPAPDAAQSIRYEPL